MSTSRCLSGSGWPTSLRRSENLRAKLENFDGVRRRLRVRVKGGRQRNRPLTRGITAVPNREREMAKDPDGWIFPIRRSRSGHVESMDEAFARCVVEAMLDPSVVVPHTMRHTAITRYPATGADLKSMQQFSGHLSIPMVVRYADASDQAIDKALDRMEGGTTGRTSAGPRPREFRTRLHRNSTRPSRLALIRAPTGT